MRNLAGDPGPVGALYRSPQVWRREKEPHGDSTADGMERRRRNGSLVCLLYYQVVAYRHPEFNVGLAYGPKG